MLAALPCSATKKESKLKEDLWVLKGREREREGRKQEESGIGEVRKNADRSGREKGTFLGKLN